MRKSLSQSSPGCSPQRALANCKMAGYPDDYIGEAPFGSTFGIQLPILHPLSTGGYQRMVNRASCPLRLPRRGSALDLALRQRPSSRATPCLRTGDYIVNGDKGTKYSRKANFTCLLE